MHYTRTSHTPTPHTHNIHKDNVVKVLLKPQQTGPPSASKQGPLSASKQGPTGDKAGSVGSNIVEERKSADE